MPTERRVAGTRNAAKRERDQADHRDDREVRAGALERHRREEARRAGHEFGPA